VRHGYLARRSQVWDKAIKDGNDFLGQIRMPVKVCVHALLWCRATCCVLADHPVSTSPCLTVTSPTHAQGLESKPIDGWFKLLPRQWKDKTKGEVHIKVEYRYVCPGPKPWPSPLLGNILLTTVGLFCWLRAVYRRPAYTLQPVEARRLDGRL
jgi:hypothetical protein